MMEKKLKEAEFALCLMLIGLPCLLRIYSVNSGIFWLLLAIIDVASIQFFDEAYFMKHYEEAVQTPRGKRVRFYLFAIMAGYLCIGFKSISLMLILFANDLALSILSAFKIFFNKSR